MPDKEKTTATDGETTEGDADKEKDQPKPLLRRRVTFADLRRAKVQPELRGIVMLRPEEMGKDPEDLGCVPGEVIGVVYRPFEAGEETDIREVVKDFEAGKDWAKEYYDEICLHCIDEPKFPYNSEGRRELQNWLPGTRQYIARLVQNQSGMGDHIVASAKEELGKLVAVTPRTSSI
jgi:hypothetical protein